MSARAPRGVMPSPAAPSGAASSPASGRGEGEGGGRDAFEALLVTVGAIVAVDRTLPLPKDLSARLNEDVEIFALSDAADDVATTLVCFAAEALRDHPENYFALAVLRAAYDFAADLRRPKREAEPSRWEEKAGLMGGG